MMTSLLAVMLALTADPVTVVTLGDSITKGARPGVTMEQTFASLIEKELAGVKVINVGVGGERTDGGLKRLNTAVLIHKPAVVTIMYGTNDSFIDTGKKEPRLSLEAYRKNLTEIVTQLKAEGVKPILMTEPCWGPKATRRNGIGEHPNVTLEPYMKVCREVAEAEKVPLVDHYAHWQRRAKAGDDVDGWTTDGCHPNAKGHEVIAELMLPAVRLALGR
jgi:lysophospholipase L1-like esterase